MDNFFTPEKLTQLRELAMEEIAYRLDRHRREDEQRAGEKSASGSERVMVCLSSRSPHADGLLRKAARVADRMGAPWYAVYVQTPREAPEHIDAATQRVISNNMDLARQLGGTTFEFKGPDLVSTIDTFVKEYGITHIIMGRTQRPWYLRLFRPSVLERLLQVISGVDVIVADISSSSSSA
jgi:two-component system sensor histidine kinase KdpD